MHDIPMQAIVASWVTRNGWVMVYHRALIQARHSDDKTPAIQMGCLWQDQYLMWAHVFNEAAQNIYLGERLWKYVNFRHGEIN